MTLYEVLKRLIRPTAKHLAGKCHHFNSGGKVKDVAVLISETGSSHGIQ